jgi:hypothetical protein
VINVSIPLPVLFDRLPEKAESGERYQALAEAAEVLGTFAMIPWHQSSRADGSIVPVVRPDQVDAFLSSDGNFAMVELEGWHRESFEKLRGLRPKQPVLIRLPYEGPVREALALGARCFHLTADYHGETRSGFVLDAIRELHQELVASGVREEVTLMGSGGIAVAEHVPKAIMCGLDAVALDTPLLVAWQGRMIGEVQDSACAAWDIPTFPREWGVQRIVNLCGSWRDQLLEILGAMGLREVRRLRGEVGRAMFQADLEREAFAGISGFGGEG